MQVGVRIPDFVEIGGDDNAGWRLELDDPTHEDLVKLSEWLKAEGVAVAKLVRA